MTTSPISAKFPIVAIASIALSGCASLTSQRVNPAKETPDGLVYHLPMQQLEIAIIVDKDGNEVLSATPTAMLADTSQRYVARYQRSQVTRNTLELSVTPSGLLNSEQKGEAQSNVASILSALAEVSAMKAFGLAEKPCKNQGTYRIFVDPAVTRESSLCGLTITIDPLGGEYKPSSRDTLPTNSHGDRQHGIFYRQAQPFKVSASGNSVFVAVVTRKSPVNFLPIPRSLLANSSWSFTFANGVPTEYKPSTDSELLGLVKLPATVIASYSTALTAGFTRRTNEMTAESNWQAAYMRYAIAEQKFEACKAAVATGEESAIAEKCK